MTIRFSTLRHGSPAGRRRLAVVALAGSAVLGSSSLSGAVAHAEPRAVAVNDVFAYTAPGTDPEARLTGLDPTIDGVSWLFSWDKLEPSPGRFNWAPVDRAVAASAASGRTAMLRVLAGAWSPAWADQVTIDCPSCFFDPPPGPVSMPIPWSSQFLSAWTGFIAAMGARYASNPDVSVIQMTGGGYQGEMYLPNWPGWWDPTQTGGDVFTDTNWIDMWETIIGAYHSAFPSTALALAIDKGLGPDGGPNLRAVMKYARQFVPQVRYQQNGLSWKTGPTDRDYVILSQESALTRVGWQMADAVPTPAKLQHNLQTALNSHATYVEVYLANCVNQADFSAIDYFAGGGT